MARRESPRTRAADVDEKRNQRRLIDVSPTQVIAARHVVELIAEVAVAVVEVDVEEEAWRER